MITAVEWQGIKQAPIQKCNRPILIVPPKKQSWVAKWMTLNFSLTGKLFGHKFFVHVAKLTARKGRKKVA